MATVYRAHDRRHNRRVAIKVLDPEVAATLGTARFLQEITTAAGLSHPNIVPVYDSGEHGGVVYYVMPYVEGTTLREELSGGKRLLPGEVARIAVRIASALDFAHRNGIVHRDIKPENIMLFEGEPLVLDFGIARAITAAAGENLTRTGIAIGTPAYLSPEQASGDSGLDGRSDQYSLACTIYEMVAGTQPFIAGTSQAVIAKRFTERPQSLAGVFPEVTRPFADALTRAMSLEPVDRFPTASEFAQELARGAQAAETPARTDTSPKSVAVLPFANTSADAENEFFADGITEEIINALTRVRALRVPARTASFAFKGKTEAIEEIARKLRVSNILEGSVRRAGNRLRVTVQLVTAPGGDTIWSDRYDRELADVFAIQDEIATSIVDALKVVLSGDEEVAIRKVPTQSIRAYEYYLRGRQLYHQRKPEPLAAAEEMFRRAIALDPGYALAYAGLADASGVRYGSFGGGDEALAQADAASKHALELDPTLAEAHAARGLALSYHAQFDEADRELREAIRLDPTSYDNAVHYARVLVSAGRLEEAAPMFETAASLRPEDYQALALANAMYHALGREAEHRDAGLRAVEAATHALAINPADTRALTLGALTLLRIGDQETGREWLERALKLDAANPITFYNASCFESLAGRTDAALDYLQQAVHLGLHHVHWLLNDPDMAGLRDHPRFATVLREAEAAAAG